MSDVHTNQEHAADDFTDDAPPTRLRSKQSLMSGIGARRFRLRRPLSLLRRNAADQSATSSRANKNSYGELG
ncbi:MAG: hypothetical protein GY758_29425 [Fuerstiella sp.]|nr:hypothetical protein [Fuerstiella sp.]MDG2127814.1 hypothetical protein [Fuerstiella sp.]